MSNSQLHDIRTTEPRQQANFQTPSDSVKIWYNPSEHWRKISRQLFYQFSFPKEKSDQAFVWDCLTFKGECTLFSVLNYRRFCLKKERWKSKLHILFKVGCWQTGSTSRSSCCSQKFHCSLFIYFLLSRFRPPNETGQPMVKNQML